MKYTHSNGYDRHLNWSAKSYTKRDATVTVTRASLVIETWTFGGKYMA